MTEGALPPGSAKNASAVPSSARNLKEPLSNETFSGRSA